ncbi:MAG: deaminase [Spirochaetes bacterium]|nr:deaminase [Spirochaetota bacterium]
MRKTVFSDKAPPPIGPYSQAVQAGPFLFVSGQIPINPLRDELIMKPFADAVRQVMANLRAVLTAGGMDFEHLVKVTVYLKNMKDFQEFNSIYATYFPGEKPARAVVEVSQLPKGCEIEIEGTAYRA